MQQFVNAKRWLKVFSVLNDVEKVSKIFGLTSVCVEQRLSDLGAFIGSNAINREAEMRLRGSGVGELWQTKFLVMMY